MRHINMSDEDAASSISGVAIVATQPVISTLVPFALNPAQAMQGVINFAKWYNVKLYKKGTYQLSNDLFD